MLAAGLVVTALGLVAGVQLAALAPVPGAHAGQPTEPAVEEMADAPRIRQAIEAAIDSDTRRGAPRLPRVTIDTIGDVTVVLALRNEADDPDATYAAALDDKGKVCAQPAPADPRC